VWNAIKVPNAYTEEKQDEMELELAQCLLSGPTDLDGAWVKAIDLQFVASKAVVLTIVILGQANEFFSTFIEDYKQWQLAKGGGSLVSQD